MARFRRRSDRWVMPLSDVPADAGSDLGVIARGWLAARRASLPVAPGFVVRASAFSTFQRSELPPDHDLASLLRVVHRPKGIERAALARERLLQAELDPRLQRELAEGLEGLLPDAPHGVRLFASPDVPGWETARVAGLLSESEVVRNDAELRKALRVLWSRLLEEDALHHLRLHRIKDVPVSVLAMPAPGDAPAGWIVHEGPRVGLPEPSFGVFLEGAGPTTDAFRVTGGGVVLGGWERASEKCGADWLKRLAEIGLGASATGPHAVRFHGSTEADLVALEIRRLSAVALSTGGASTTRWARSTVGAGEPWARHTAFSLDLASAAAEARVRRARVAAGRPLSRSDKPVVAISGRCFVEASVLDLPQQASELPWAQLQELGGAQLAPERAWLAPPSSSLARLGIITARVATEVRRLTESVDRFDREAEQQRRWLAELDLGILPDDALKTTLREGREFFAQCERLTGDCAAAHAVSESALSALLMRVADGQGRRMAMQVSGGIGDLEVTKPAIALAHVIEIARRDPAAATWLDSAVIDLGEERGPAARAFRQFLDAFGDLVDGDAELSRPRWSERPEGLLAVVRAALVGPPLDPDGATAFARGQADRIESRAEAGLSFVEVRLYRELVARVRDLVRLNSRLRVRVAHARAMLRTIALDVDWRLGRLDPSFPPAGALDCRFEELVQAVGSSRADLGPLVQLRRASRFVSDPFGLPAVFTGGLPAWPDLPTDPAQLPGIGVSDGSVVGRVRFIGSGGAGVQTLAPGEIAVLEAADLGHGPLMWVASAVISEIGNAWSDGAVLARELAKPMVSGVPYTRVLLTEGERVRVDGTRGVIERLDVP